MRILISPNAYKNSLAAPQAAAAIEAGFRKSGLPCTCSLFPIGDGGDGTADILVERFKGTLIQTTTSDALGRRIQSSFGWIAAQRTAVIELSKASGLRLLEPHEYDPLRANTAGTGKLILAALDFAPKRIILCIGGSATVDGATGILHALGVKFYDSNRKILLPHPQNLRKLSTIDYSLLDPRLLKTELVILCDVDNTLLGERGAAAVFGPQKGATQNMVAELETGLSHWQQVVAAHTGKDMSKIKYGGAAGGVASGLWAILGATLVNGTDYFLDLTGFDVLLNQTDLLITGEGSIDLQTIQGKAPFGVARRAKSRGIPVVGLAGKIPTSPETALDQYFDLLVSINREPAELFRALKNTEKNLLETARVLGQQLLAARGDILKGLKAMKSE